MGRQASRQIDLGGAVSYTVCMGKDGIGECGAAVTPPPSAWLARPATEPAQAPPEEQALAPALYVVATPIGNVADMAPRAASVLERADIIAAEDTRVTRALLHSLGIKPGGRIVSNHKFSEKRRLDALLGALRGGRSVALVSDAGTPCISDPGSVLAAAAASEGFDVIAVCGASAVAAALSVSGLDCGAFAFRGFFPRAGAEAERALVSLGREGILPVSVFFESPMRIVRTARLIAAAHPGAWLCVCNDLTKRYERVYRGAPADVLRELEGNPSHEKGEYTIVMDVRGPAAQAGEGVPSNPGELAEGGGSGADALSLEAMIVDYMAKHGCTAKDAVAALRNGAAANAAPKKAWYAAALRLKGMLSPPPPPDAPKSD